MMDVAIEEEPVQVRTAAASIPALEQLSEKHRETLRAEARREAAIRELDAARSSLQEARTELRSAVRAARATGATFPQIASVLGVSVQRAQALSVGPHEAARR